MVVGLINALIIRSVKAANFGTKLTEDMAAADISVWALETRVGKLRTILIIFSLP